MIHLSGLKVGGIIALVILSGMSVGSAGTPSRAADPTIPSSQIMAKLRGNDAPARSPLVAPDHRDAGSLELTLKGLVLSDADRGTAIIAHKETQFAVVALDRSKAEPTRVKIGGITLVVADFSATKVTLQTLDGSRSYQVPRPRD